MTKIRAINDSALDGPTNMARDEALLMHVGQGRSPPTLRFYEWSPPTVSLGYFQHYAEFSALPPPAGRLPVVRRPTGGGAILHDLELTYSLAIPLDHALLSGGPNRLYERAHDAVIGVLGEIGLEVRHCGESDGSGGGRGPFFCFERRHSYDVVLGPFKIAGSAQRRTRQGVLQHGSIVLANRFPQQPTGVVVREADTDKIAAEIEHFRSAFPVWLAKQEGIEFEEDSWGKSELQTAAQLHRKYAGPEWTRRM